MDDIRGHKDNMCAAKKNPNKIWCKISREYFKFPTFTKYQKTQKEFPKTQINARNNKR
jgi:hypothetical protein